MGNPDRDACPRTALLRRPLQARQIAPDHRMIGRQKQAPADQQRQLAGLGHAHRWDQRAAVFIGLADDPGPVAGRPVIGELLKLGFDESAALLDDQDFLETAGEGAHAVWLERPDQAQLTDRKPDLQRNGFGDAQCVQGLAHIQIGLAGRYNAQAPPRRVDHNLIETVGLGEG